MKKLKNIIFAFVLHAALWGCGAQEKETAPEKVVVDDFGSPVSFSSTPRRLVTLVPGVTEMVAELGDADKIVGVTVYEDLPLIKKRIKQKKIAVVGRGLDPPLEKIVSLDPDLVLMNGKGHNRVAEKIRQLKIKTFSFDPYTVDELLEDFDKLGAVLGREKEAAAFKKKFSGRVAFYNKKKKHKKIRVYMEMWDNPLMSIGSKALENELLEDCGGENIFKDMPQNVFSVDEEAVISRNPDVIFIVREKAFHYNTLEKRKAWESLNAVRKKKVYDLKSDLFRRGPQILNALEKICSLLNS